MSSITNVNIATLSPIKQLPRPEEVSHLRSPRDTGTLYNAWKRERELVRGYNQTIQLVNQLAREIKKLESRTTLDLDFFPFKIYNLPSEFQVNPVSPNNWRTFNIRGGYVFTQTFFTGSTFVNGTDRIEPVAYQNILSPPPYNAGQYTVPTGSAQYWFWVEKSGSATNGSPYFIRASSTPQIPDNLFNPNGWIGWPSASIGSGSNHIIGYVDTVSSAANNNAIVRQIQVGDILASGGTLPATVVVNICNTATGNIDIYKLYGNLSASINVTGSI